MNQESFGKLIKELREKNKLTQKQLAEKYRVTYQAVSKWENGINMPDISIIKQMSEDFNVDLGSMLEGNYDIKKKNKKFISYVLGCLIIVLIGITIFLKTTGGFESKTLTTTCMDFNLNGSASYDNEKLAIHIFNIEYCGNNNKKYQKIECILFEANKGEEKVISSSVSDENEEIELEEFLKNVRFTVDSHAKICKVYDNDNLYIKIIATDLNDSQDIYKIPITLEENCN